MKRLMGMAAALFLSVSGAALADGLMVEAPWIREAPPNAPALGGFMVIKNHGEKARNLVSAESPAFGEVQLHRTVMEEGMAKMIHQKAIEIPAQGAQTFAPGGYHLMLMRPKQPLSAGEKVEVTLHFDDGEAQPVVFPVRSGMGGMDHGAMDHGAMNHSGNH